MRIHYNRLLGRVFATTARGEHVTMPQLGRVLLGDGVEIGANSTVDRGGMTDTVIGAGTRIDNLVQIAHGVQIGRCCALAAQVGIAGSTVIEDFVLMGGQAGAIGHLVLGRGAKVAAQTGVMNDLAPGEEVAGSPAQPRRAVLREIAYIRRMVKAPKPNASPGKKTD